ncbi:hypothetical protein VTG60DRAFT_4426 [Thermothelomyces hinnuleus]
MPRGHIISPGGGSPVTRLCSSLSGRRPRGRCSSDLLPSSCDAVQRFSSLPRLADICGLRPAGSDVSTSCVHQSVPREKAHILGGLDARCFVPDSPHGRANVLCEGGRKIRYRRSGALLLRVEDWKMRISVKPSGNKPIALFPGEAWPPEMDKLPLCLDRPVGN